CFHDGWFKTGDLGSLDADGYLFLKGRKKEFINRGGEKISPYEIEDVLCRHPDVATAAVFPVPDPRLSEEIAAAVVLNNGAALTQRTLLDYLANELADFKLPRHIKFVKSLPVSAMGK